MTKITEDELNKMNAEFWRVGPANHAERMKDPALREAAVARLASEERRAAPFRNRMTIEGAAVEAEQLALKTAVHVEQRIVSARARRAASVKRIDALQAFIHSVVKKKRSITVPDLLDKIRAEAGSGGRIDNVHADSIWFVGSHGQSREAPISGLKDRLWRARKKLKPKD